MALKVIDIVRFRNSDGEKVNRAGLSTARWWPCTSTNCSVGRHVPHSAGLPILRLRVEFSPGSALDSRIATGVDADLLVSPADFSEPFLSNGQLVAGSRANFARSVVAFAVRAGTSKPDIRSTESLRQALLDARSISYSRGASGLQFIDLAQRLGILDEVKLKTVLPHPGELVGSVVARGAAEIGVQQVSELLPVPGIEVVSPLPPELRKDIIYSISSFSGRRGGAVASAFSEFLRSPVVAPVLKKHGLEPF